MRDPKRIPQVIESLRAAWYLNPDLRLGQLVSLAVSEGTDPHTRRDPFYVEDDIISLGLGRMMAK